MLFSHPDRNLILTGYTGPSQPLVGQQIADRLKMRYVNVDALLEARGEMDIDDMRTRYGETRLKMLENDVMQDVLLYRGAVIRVSGQTILRTETTARLLDSGYIICLVVALDEVLRRLHLSLGGRYHNPSERALAIGHLKREWAIRKVEGVHELNVTDMSESRIVNTVCDIWERLSIGQPPSSINNNGASPLDTNR
jgi:shikimate kinase